MCTWMMCKYMYTPTCEEVLAMYALYEDMCTWVCTYVYTHHSCTHVVTHIINTSSNAYVASTSSRVGVYIYMHIVLSMYALLDVFIIWVTTCVHEWCVYTYVHTHTWSSACYVCVAGYIYYMSRYMCTWMMCVFVCSCLLYPSYGLLHVYIPMCVQIHTSLIEVYTYTYMYHWYIQISLKCVHMHTCIIHT